MSPIRHWTWGCFGKGEVGHDPAPQRCVRFRRNIMANGKTVSGGFGRVSRQGLTRASLLMSVASFAIALSSAPARAECAPESGMIVCSGLDANGFVSTVEGQVTTILSGAT